jgi:hypothetical protein
MPDALQADVNLYRTASLLAGKGAMRITKAPLVSSIHSSPNRSLAGTPVPSAMEERSGMGATPMTIGGGARRQLGMDDAALFAEPEMGMVGAGGAKGRLGMRKSLGGGALRVAVADGQFASGRPLMQPSDVSSELVSIENAFGDADNPICRPLPQVLAVARRATLLARQGGLP